MKKSLLALAVIGAFAGAANAQSSVTLYGVVDEYLERDSTGQTSGSDITNTQLSSGGLSGSRFGLRGSEDLGGGNSAIFTLESGFSADTGRSAQGGRLFGRQGFAGFAGGWGQLTAGRQYAPIFYTQADSDADGFSNFSQPAHLANINGNTLRQDNQIRYTTAALGTFKGMLSFAPGENPSTAAGGTTAGRIVGANFTVGAGPANIVGGYHRENAASASSATLNSITVWSLGANATFGSFTPVLNYFQQKTDNITAADSTIKSWSLGGTYGLGPWAFLLQYGQIKNDAPVSAGGASNTGAKEKFLELGADYVFSKRTNLYLRYAEAKDSTDSGVATRSAGSGYLGFSAAGLAPGKKDSLVALGLRHRF